MTLHGFLIAAAQAAFATAVYYPIHHFVLKHLFQAAQPSSDGNS